MELQKNKMEKQTITANWSIELNVCCPHCGIWFDIFGHWREQEMWSCIQVGESKKLGVDRFEITCPGCEKEFTINEVMH